MSGMNIKKGDKVMLVLKRRYQFWVAALGWAGVRAGNVLNALTVATGDAKAAGGSGSRVAISAAKGSGK